MIQISGNDLNNLDKRYRTTLINSLAGIRQVALVGTMDTNRQSNLSIINSVIHLGAEPSLFGYISRPHTVERHTLENILETKHYTFNFVTQHFIKNAHQTSARYPKNQSEFKECGFQEEIFENQFVFVKEASVKIGMKFLEKITIKQNNTDLIIGEIQNVFIEPSRLEKDGFVNLENTLMNSGLDTYYVPEKIGKLSYAKPNSKPQILIS